MNKSSLGKRLVAGAALAATATLVLAGCSTSASSAGGTGSTAKQYKAVVLSDGAKNDQSWSNSVFDGLSQIPSSLHVKTDFVGPNTSVADYEQQGASYASQGYNEIVITDGSALEAAIKLAKQFPNVKVVQGPESPTTADLATYPKNLTIWNLKQQDGTFLAGVLAGLITKTDKIGAVSGGKFPAVIRQSEGFALGARCVNPKVTMTSLYTGSFSDTSLAQSAAQTVTASGADVILSAVDSAVKGVYSAADSSSTQTYVIPSYFDSYKQDPKSVLTSVLYNLNGVTADLIERGAKGTLPKSQYVDYTYANLQVGALAGFHGRAAVTSAIQTKLTAIEKKLRDGTIVVPNESGATQPLSVIGAGSKIDPASIGC